MLSSTGPCAALCFLNRKKVSFTNWFAHLCKCLENVPLWAIVNFTAVWEIEFIKSKDVRIFLLNLVVWRDSCWNKITTCFFFFHCSNFNFQQKKKKKTGKSNHFHLHLWSKRNQRSKPIIVHSSSLQWTPNLEQDSLITRIDPHVRSEPFCICSLQVSRVLSGRWIVDRNTQISSTKTVDHFVMIFIFVRLSE